MILPNVCRYLRNYRETAENLQRNCRETAEKLQRNYRETLPRKIVTLNNAKKI
jgi:hypothetical protein